ncbi:MAG: replication-associated recombination protein A [Bacteroidia bacterium]|nr:replication-associated recombination protein A [Bacteroidia bacterium]NNJ56661.1 replication-associated recombination protein A [Bacteroidia bacterium]
MQNIPLAERVRPKSLDELVGQQHIIGKNKPLRKSLEQGVVFSCIFWGPPGVGKTTLAQIISHTLKTPFFQLSAVNAGVKDVREVIEKAKKTKFLGSGGSAILFIDEIHRFNKSQQDALLGAVEAGIITLIGATTENPSFEVNAALLSRCEVFVLKPLELSDLKDLVARASKEDSFLKEKKITVKEWDALIRISGGDGRKLLNAIEIIVNYKGGKTITISNKVVDEAVQQKLAMFDKGGEQHYDIVSAFIKSIRGSDPNAAVYYLARMIEGGEDPKFIARRLLISASEDIGNANPNALLLADACFRAVSTIGYPECRINLSQTTIYLACSAKSNASYLAIKSAQALVKQTGDLSIPLGLRNAPTKLMKDLDYGKGYKYAHDHPNNFISQEYLPDEVSGSILYNPGNNAMEEKQRKRLKALWKEKYGY